MRLYQKLSHLIFVTLMLLTHRLFAMQIAIEKEPLYYLQGLLCPVPQEIYDFIATIKNQSENPYQAAVLIDPLTASTGPINCLFLYGPPGNGKTTCAQTIAQETGSILLEIHGADVVEAYPGKGAQKIQALADQAKALSAAGKKVTIFIDEVELFAGNIETEYRAEHKLSAGKLNEAILDKLANDKNIVIILATNKIDKLNGTLTSRTKMVKIPNPTYEQRKKVFTVIFLKQNLPRLNKEVFNREIKKTIDAQAEQINNLVQEALQAVQSIPMNQTDVKQWYINFLKIYHSYQKSYETATHHISLYDLKKLQQITAAYATDITHHLEQLLTLITNGADATAEDMTTAAATLNQKIQAIKTSQFNLLPRLITLYRLLEEIDLFATRTERPINQYPAQAMQFNLLMQKIEREKQALAIELNNTESESYAAYLELLHFYLAKVTIYVEQQPAKLDPHFLDRIAQETEGLSLRSIIKIQADIKNVLASQKKGLITEEIMWQEIKKIITEKQKTDKEKLTTEEKDLIFKKYHAVTQMVQECKDSNSAAQIKKDSNYEELEEKIKNMEV